ncbi:MAG: glycosyltransferase family 2 protein [Ilumatobacteraceae bacterium]|nr:glycosyltransferase family 2 protein [Ilumatobacteraceae bacterium]
MDILVTAVVVNYNTRELLEPCISALRSAAGSIATQIVIIDNASRDGSQEVLRRDFSDCDLLFNEVNVGFGRANNQALALARGRYLLLVNTDAFLASGALEKTVGFMETCPSCGLLGVRLVGRDGVLQPSCRYFPTPWNEFLSRTGLARFFPKTRLIDDMAWDHRSIRECDWVPGCYYLVRRSVIDAVGLFDPRYFLYYEEVDHCRAIKAAGWTVVFYPDSTVVHLGGESAKSDSPVTLAGRQIDALQIESALLYHRKHHGLGGLAASVLLTTLADTLLAIKWLLRPRGDGGVGAYWAHSRATWGLLRKTSGGRVPTR